MAPSLGPECACAAEEVCEGGAQGILLGSTVEALGKPAFFALEGRQGRTEGCDASLQGCPTGCPASVAPAQGALVGIKAASGRRVEVGPFGGRCT